MSPSRGHRNSIYPFRDMGDNAEDKQPSSNWREYIEPEEYNSFPWRRRPSPVYGEYDEDTKLERPYQHQDGLPNYMPPTPTTYSSHPSNSRSYYSQDYGNRDRVNNRDNRRPSPSPLNYDRGPPRSPPRSLYHRTQTKPTEEYNNIALQGSFTISDPTKLRKLIVLDLNGSLLLRSPHQPKRPVGPYADPTLLRPLRVVHPRPYMASFTEYLFHESTKEWLDAMVWSSAQPHSVKDMVDRTFKEKRSELKAVWARDTLGLNNDDYNKKSKTVKDLAKPWAELAELPTSGNSQRHSALTTLLVDDSPLKAALQPFNHLCIREYVQPMRKLDLAVADWELAKEGTRAEKLKTEALLKEADQSKDVIESVNDPNVTKLIREVVMIDGKMVNTEEVLKRVTHEVVMVYGEMVEPEPDPNAPAQNQSRSHQKRRLKRQIKREQERKEREEALMALATKQNSSSEATEVSKDIGNSDLHYDETLLSVIGVLDHIRYEGNVAGWMHNGGLIRVAHSEMDHSPSNDDGAHTPPTREGSPSSKRRKVTHELDEDDDLEIQLPPSSMILPPSSSQPSADEEHEEQAFTGIPLSSSPPSSPTRRHNNRKDPFGSEEPSLPPLWYEDPSVLNYWVNRGRLALKILGIEARSGIKSSLEGGSSPKAT